MACVLSDHTVDLTSLMIPFDHLNTNTTLYCSDLTLQDRYHFEFLQLSHYPTNQLIHQPSIEQYAHPSTYPRLPYFYSLWKTSALLPRLMTPCEHHLYITLLKRFDQVCRQHHIDYMISHGTVLGSYRNHDILPYDDDVDALISMKHYSRMVNISRLTNTTDWQLYVNTASNMKFFFRQSPSAGGYAWKWPFIGINFYSENRTHIKSGNAFEKSTIFPLVLRPLGSLWLLGPRDIKKFLEVRSKYHYAKLSIDSKCYSQKYSHKEERVKYRTQQIVNCADLRSAYPYIRRRCDPEGCYESLMLNEEQALYVLKMNEH